MSKKDIQLDKFDRRILFELDRNSRISTTKLAKSIRKSKQFVDYRIKKLEESGILKGYIAAIDYSRLGYLSVRVYFKFHNLTPKKREKLENDLLNDKEVWWLVSLDGPWDLGYATAVKHVLDFYGYWDKIMKKYRKYIRKRLVVLYTNIRQYPKSYLIGKDNEDTGTLVGASKEVIPYTKFDSNLLKLISVNARMSLIEMADKLGSSPQVVKNHIKRLEWLGIIQGYRALIDVDLLGYKYYKAYVNLLNTSEIESLNSYCFSNPHILNLNRTIGGVDYEMEIQTKSYIEFKNIMDEIKEKFSGMIDDYEFVIGFNEKKMNYFPFE